MKVEDLTADDIEAIEALADSDLRSSKYAQAILESVEGHTSDRVNDPEETDTNPTETKVNDTQQDSIAEQQNEPTGSIFAY